ncbi:MAG TPA: hypothetical protein VHZ95_11545 [Polyangiales bacterium]|jgi:hypothetical protein|nr:hypothetical protein [Polyangiales bacterium]
MTQLKHWRGLSSLIADAVEHGSRAVERVHMATARRPFVILEQIPGVAQPTRAVHVIHDVAVTNVYRTIRIVNGAVSALLGFTLDVLETREAGRPKLVERSSGDVSND